MRGIQRLVVFAAVLGAAALTAAPASAEPSTLKIDAVFQLPCAASVCDEGTDAVVPSDGTVSGAVQIHFRAASSFGLETADLQARLSNGTWVCLAHYELNGGSLNARLNWNTKAWPDSCPGVSAATPTKNGTYPLRLLVKERVTGDSFASPAYTVRVANAPSTPAWAADPVVRGAQDGEPVVELRFTRAPESDVFEYHYIRTDPGGGETEWAISAAKPGGQGCDVEGDVYVCYDDAFPSERFGGTYSYVLVAFRQSPSGSTTCALPPNPICIRSAPSEVRAASLVEPTPSAPPPSSTPTIDPTRTPSGARDSAARGTARTTRRGGGSTGGSRPDFSDFYTGTYEESLPYGEQPFLVPRGSRSQTDDPLAAGDGSFVADEEPVDRRRLWQSIAGGLAMLLAAAHVALVLRRS